MSNIINNLLLNESAIPSTTTGEQVVKETPSLFDSLLSTATSAKEVITADNSSVSTKNVEVNEPKIENTKIEIPKDINTAKLNEQNQTEVVVENNKEIVNNSATSLLDKLVIEAKKDTTTQDVLTTVMNSNLTLNDKLGDNVSLITKEVNPINTTVSVDVAKVETPKEAVVNNKEEVKVEAVVETPELNKIVDTTDENQKVVNNPISSLLDKLVIEAKKDLDKTNSKDLISNKIVDATVSADVAKVETPKEAVVNNKEEVKVDLKVDTSQTTADTIVPAEKEVIREAETVSIVENKELSLMDKLIQKTTEKIVSADVNNMAAEISTKKVITEDLITNIYLGSQKNQLNNQSLFNKKEAVSLLKEGTNVQAVKVSAEMLDLGLENIDIQQIKDDKLDIKKTTIDIVDRKSIIDNILSQKNVKSEEVKNLITQSVEASKALLKDELHFAEDSVVNVNSPLSYNIQSKIIGAKQQMATVMSDIARQMYENYKPPVTAFRINLNPTELGSIAILMKSDKSNGLSISLNASNSVTLDTLIENQNVLKNSLNKTFSENTKFNLDFNSSNENNSNQFSGNQNNQQNNRRFEQQIDTQSILQLQEENKNIEEKILDYM